MRKICSRRNAFTLIELLIVICIISILFVVLISRVDFATDKARIAGAQNDIRALQTAVHKVALEDSKIVDDLTLLALRLNKNIDSELTVRVENNCLKTNLTDPWGTYYKIQYDKPNNTQGQATIMSAGPDTTFYTKDDIVSVVSCNITKNGIDVIIKENVESPDNPNEQPGEHMCIFNQRIINTQYIASVGNCANEALYYFSCSCGNKGTTMFNGSKDPNVHVEGVVNKYASISNKQHNNNATCVGCNYVYNTTVENHEFSNNICIKCGYVHQHEFNVQNTDSLYKKSDATCASPAIYYFSCECLEKGNATFEYGSKSLTHGDLDTTYIYYDNQQHEKKETCVVCHQNVSDEYENHQYNANHTCILCEEHVHKFDEQNINNDYLMSPATCINRAVYFYKCIGCIQKGTETFEFGEYASHIWCNKEDDAYINVEATCNSVAIYYKSCSVCNALSDETFYGTQCNSSNHGDDKHIYNYVNDLIHSKTIVCERCNEIRQEAVDENHVFNTQNVCTLCNNHVHKYESKTITDKYKRTDATCTTKATYFYKCVGCDDNSANYYEYGETTEHNYIDSVYKECEKTAPTCINYGVYYKTCSVCMTQSTEWFVSSVIDNENHVGEKSQNVSQYSDTQHVIVTTCLDCEKDINESKELHQFDGNNNCTICNYHKHIYNQQFIVEKALKTKATCETQAVYYYSCICGEVGTDTFVYGSVLPHANIVTIPGLPPTCTDYGYTESTKCDDCKTILTKAEILSPSHSFVLKTSIAATCIQYSCNVYECTICGEIKEEYGTAYGSHNYVNMVCTICGHRLALSAGLYDEDWNLVASWSALRGYGMDITALWNSTTNTKHLSQILQKEELVSGVHLVVPSSVTNIGMQALRNCTTLKTITLPDTITKFDGHAFKGCTNLESINIPDNLKMITNEAFYGCTNLKNVYIGPNCKITAICNSAFYKCTNLTYINVPSTVTSIEDSAFGYSGITEITLPNALVEIENSAFQYCSQLQVVNWGDNMTLSEIPSKCFSSCKSLTSIVLPQSVVSIDTQAFLSCTNLTKLEIGDNVAFVGTSAIPSSVECYIHDGGKYLGNENNHCVVFMGAVDKTLTTQTITPGTKTIASTAFSGCYKMTSVSIPDSVMYIGDQAFFNNNRLVSVTIPANVISIGSLPFKACYGLKEIVVDENNQYYKSINGCLLTKDGKTFLQYPLANDDEVFVVPDGVEIITSYSLEYTKFKQMIVADSVIKFMQDAMYKSEVETIIFGENSKLSTLEIRAFYYCSSLTNIILPKSITHLNDAFRYTGMGTVIYYAGTVEEWGNVYMHPDVKKSMTKVICSDGEFIISA